MFIGIDFSMNSTALTLETEKEILFFVYPTKITNIMRDKLDQVDVKVYLQENEKPKDYKNITIRERFNTIMAIKLAKSISDSIKPYINKDTKIAIEGISFMSKGNSIAQVSGYHYILRKELIDLVGIENIFIYSPLTVKKFAGGGRFKKDDMIKAFFELGDEKLQVNKLYLKSKGSDFMKSKSDNYLKPFDDFVDSYFVMKMLKSGM